MTRVTSSWLPPSRTVPCRSPPPSRGRGEPWRPSRGPLARIRRAHSSVIVLSTCLPYETCDTVHDATGRDPTHPCAFAAQGSRGGEIASTSFSWAHASWDNAECGVPGHSGHGRRHEDRGRALVTRKRVAREDREKANLRV